MCPSWHSFCIPCQGKSNFLPYQQHVSSISQPHHAQCITRHHWRCQSSYQLPWQRQLLTYLLSNLPAVNISMIQISFIIECYIETKQNHWLTTHKMTWFNFTVQLSLLWPEWGQLQPSSISQYCAPVQVPVHHTGQQVIQHIPFVSFILFQYVLQLYQ